MDSDNTDMDAASNKAPDCSTDCVGCLLTDFVFDEFIKDVTLMVLIWRRLKYGGERTRDDMHSL